MRSEQGLSGGGHAYTQSALQAGTVDLHIPCEAEKTEAEFSHILQWQGPATLECIRVMRADGHLVVVEAGLGRMMDAQRFHKTLESWAEHHALPDLPSAPLKPLSVVDAEAQPLSFVC